MRLFLILVSLIAAHTVDSSDDLKLPGVQIPEDGNIPLDVSEENDPVDGVQQIAEGRVKRELKKISFAGFEVTQHLNAVDDVHKLNKGDKTEIANAPRRSRCKARNACVVIGGFCVTNATHCSGRVVPEGCKGLNCQCCVPGTFELEIRNLVREINSMNNNLTRENIEIKMELNSMKNNSTHENSAIKSELHSMKHKLTSDNSEIKLELSSIKHNLTNGNSAIKTELHSIKTKLIDDNLDMKIDLQSLENNLTHNTFQIKSELSAVEKNIIRALLACPAGFFRLSTGECFKYITDVKRSWTNARSKCREQGLYLAEPSDQVAAELGIYLIDEYASNAYAWMGAKADGSRWMWDRAQTELRKDNPAWFPGFGAQTSSTNCLVITVYQIDWNNNPGKPYVTSSCTSSYYTLCQKY